MTANPYHKLSLQQKQAHALGAARERPIRCRLCDAQVMPADLLSHREQRCPGIREPAPGEKWIGWREAVAIIRRAAKGLSEEAAKMRLSRWANDGAIRARGTRGERKYLHADVAECLNDRGVVVVGSNESVTDEGQD